MTVAKLLSQRLPDSPLWNTWPNGIRPEWTDFINHSIAKFLVTYRRLVLAVVLLLIGCFLALNYFVFPHDPSGIWKTPASSLAQVELRLHGNQTFESHEFWTGDDSKPHIPVYMKGSWHRGLFGVDLSISSHQLFSESGFNDYHSHPRTRHLGMSKGHIVWDEKLILEKFPVKT